MFNYLPFRMTKEELNKVAGGAPSECCTGTHRQANHYSNKDAGIYSLSLMGNIQKLVKVLILRESL